MGGHQEGNVTDVIKKVILYVIVQSLHQIITTGTSTTTTTTRLHLLKVVVVVVLATLILVDLVVDLEGDLEGGLVVGLVEMKMTKTDLQEEVDSEVVVVDEEGEVVVVDVSLTDAVEMTRVRLKHLTKETDQEHTIGEHL